MNQDKEIDVKHLVSYVYILGIKVLHKFMEAIYGCLKGSKCLFFRLEAIAIHRGIVYDK